MCVIAVAGLGASLFAPALAKSKTGTDAAVCISNKQRMIGAWTMFAADNSGTLPGQEAGGVTQNPPTGIASRPWAWGWLDWGSQTANTNTALLSDTRYSSVALYLAGDTQVFRCPSDRYVSAQQRSYGWTERARSISANVFAGPGGGAQSGPLDLAYSVQVTKLSGFNLPAPSDVWVFLDEHPDSINDPAMYPPYGGNYVDVPAAFHNRGMGVAFADGRAEVHHWRSPATEVPVSVNGQFRTPNLTTPEARADMEWLRTHSPHR